MIFQNPRAALNPIRKVGKQIEDVLLHHAQAARSAVKRKGDRRVAPRAHCRSGRALSRLSVRVVGGMCQRVVIALALACRPQLLIADEPTTGLDVTTPEGVMDLVVELTRERGMSTILITHDLGPRRKRIATRVVVMEKGHGGRSRSIAANFCCAGRILIHAS